MYKYRERRGVYWSSHAAVTDDWPRDWVEVTSLWRRHHKPTSMPVNVEPSCSLTGRGELLSTWMDTYWFSYSTSDMNMMMGWQKYDEVKWWQMTGADNTVTSINLQWTPDVLLYWLHNLLFFSFKACVRKTTCLLRPILVGFNSVKICNQSTLNNVSSTLGSSHPFKVLQLFFTLLSSLCKIRPT